jgi:hypothetical protein
MTFINSIEILGLQNYSVSVIDSSMIKKAKRKLFAEIDLSDDELFNYKGVSLTKTDCEAAINDLENPNYVEFYFYLANDNQPLNDFLVNGDERFFVKNSQESIYKLPEFINFISPYFAPRFDKAILNSFAEFKNGSLNSKMDTIDILRTQFLIAPSYINTAFKSLSIEITNRINQTEKNTKEIKNATTDYTADDIEGIVDLTKKLFPQTFLNLLPPYFLSQINKIASSINFLQLAVWDTFDDSSVCRLLLEHILSLKIESVSKRTFENNYKIVKQADEKKNHTDKLQNVLTSFESKAKTIANARQLIYQTKPYLFNLKNISKENDNTYISLSTRVAFVAQEFVIEEVNKEQSSDSSLQRLLGYATLKSVLKNAWEVVQLIGSLEMLNEFKVNRYNPNKETLQDICSKLNVATPQLNFGKIPKCNFIILNGTITHTDKDCKSLPITNPFIRSDVRYIGLDLKIETFDNQYIKFDLKYIQPNGTLNKGTSSPEGLTISNNKNINTDTKIINLSGWGNNEKGTYEVGTHHIEVWIENCMIYRKSFVVDWSQAEKAENAKREAEKRERERIEAEKRKEQARIAEQKAKEKTVRTVCLWIMGVFIFAAAIFAIWGSEGLINVGGIVGFFAALMLIGFIIGWFKSL